MVQGVVIFAVEGPSPLFSVFFTPEGNDEHMQTRQQTIIRRVHEDYLLLLQYARDVILAKPLLSSAFPEGGSRVLPPCAGGRSSSNSSSEKTPHSPRERSEEIARYTSAGLPAAAPAAPSAGAAAIPAATVTSASGRGSNADRADAAAAADPRGLPAVEEEDFPWHNVFPAAPLEDHQHNLTAAAADPEEAPMASAVHSHAVATAAAAAAAEVMDGIVPVKASSLFSSARLIIWKHVEGVCYSALCGAMENVALVLSFLSLFVHCLDEAFSLSFPNSTLPLKQQLLTRPDIVLLVLHVLLPGGQALLINSSYAAYLKKKIRASLGVTPLPRPTGVHSAGKLSP